MNFEHRRQRRRGQLIVAIAAVAHRMKRPLIHALFADVSVAIKRSRGTKQAVVMQGLHHWYAFFPARVINRRRDHREEIMDVNHIWTAVAQKNLKFLVPGPRPDTIDGRFDLAYQTAGIGCLFFYFFDLKSVLGEKLRFRFKNLVFASGLNVAVVHAQHAETCRLDGNRKSKRGHRLTTGNRRAGGDGERPISGN